MRIVNRYIRSRRVLQLRKEIVISELDFSLSFFYSRGDAGRRKGKKKKTMHNHTHIGMTLEPNKRNAVKRINHSSLFYFSFFFI